MRYLACAICFVALGVRIPAGECAGMSQSNAPAPESIHEAMFVPLNGIEQWITIRGDDVRNPVILMLHGGPGFPTSELAPAYAPFERNYTLVQWDQPGGGATYSKNLGKDVGPLTIARYRRDGIRLVEFLQRHLHTDKVILYGTSWGTILGIEMARTNPDLFSAYVGISQMAGPPGDRLGYELALQEAQGRGDKQAVADLKRVGPPPYHSFEDYVVRQKYSNPPGLPPTPQERAGYAALAKLLAAPPGPDANYIARGLPSYDGPKVFLDTNEAVFEQVQHWDPFEFHLSFKMPVMVLNGDHDLNTPAPAAMALCHAISAPRKHCEVIPGYGHGTIPIDIVLARMAKYIRPFLAK
jgi:proline iminopeptidase